MGRSWRGLAVLSTAVAVGCHGGARHENTIELWGLGKEGEVVARMIPAFEREHPGMKVRVQQIPWSAAHEKLLTAYVGGAMPDVFQVGNTWVPEFVALNAIEALDDDIRRSNAIRLEDYFPGIVDTGVIDGATYAIPWYVDTRLLFYRSDLLAAAGVSTPPTTWTAWLDAMARVKRRAGAGEFAALVPLNEWQPLVILALQKGAELLRDGDTRGNFQSAEFRDALSFYVDLFRRGLAPRASQTQIANVYQDFARGAFAFYVTGPWNLGEFRARLPRGVEWSTAPWPAPDGGYPGVSLAGGASLAIVRGSPRRAAAWQLVEFLSDPERELELYRLTGDLPARRSAWTSAGPAADPKARAFATQLEHVRATPRIPEWERIADQITRYTEEVVRERATIDETLVALDRDVDGILEKRRWMIARQERAR